MTIAEINNYLNDISNGIIWNEELCKRIDNPKCLDKYGFKVYSQNDEDGIIEEIFRRIGVTNSKFVEFGVQDGIESNGHYLLLKGWVGFWIECDKDSYYKILTKFENTIKKGNLNVINEFITKDNINKVLADNNVIGEIDLLSIDIDGNDYHVWEKIEVVNPRVVVVEYNAKIPPTCEWVMPYCEEQFWDGGDKYGASLSALAKLAKKKHYTLVGTNISGVNAFFVREDCLGDCFEILSVQQLYNPPRYYKKFFSGHPSLYCLSDLPDGRKQLFCGHTGNILFGQGFHLPEDASGIIHWMSQEKGLIWIKDEGNTVVSVRLKLEKPIIEMKIDDFPNEVSIKVERKTVYKGEIEQAEKIFQINIDREKCRNDEVIQIEIETNHVWRPIDVGIGDDTRQLGLCVRIIEII